VYVYIHVSSIYHLCMELASCVEDAVLFADYFADLHVCVCVYEYTLFRRLHESGSQWLHVCVCVCMCA
jgi:hypothetical protein